MLGVTYWPGCMREDRARPRGALAAVASTASGPGLVKVRFPAGGPRAPRAPRAAPAPPRAPLVWPRSAGCPTWCDMESPPMSHPSAPPTPPPDLRDSVPPLSAGSTGRMRAVRPPAPRGRALLVAAAAIALAIGSRRGGAGPRDVAAAAPGERGGPRPGAAARAPRVRRGARARRGPRAPGGRRRGAGDARGPAGAALRADGGGARRPRRGHGSGRGHLRGVAVPRAGQPGDLAPPDDAQRVPRASAARPGSRRRAWRRAARPTWSRSSTPRPGRPRTTRRCASTSSSSPTSPASTRWSTCERARRRVLCAAVGKRICDAHEWEGACAGALRPPEVEYVWGWPRLQAT